MKDTFFDREAVIKAIGRARAGVLKKFGLKVRKFAQKSLKYGDKPSSPGSVPTVHKSGFRKHVSKKTGKTRTRSVSWLRDRLLSDYDLTTKSVVVGPMRLDRTIDARAPSSLEYGGQSTIVEFGKKRTVTIAARPFMGPALKAELPGLPAMWKDSVR